MFSAGCHAGYNIVDADAIAGVTLPLDWAQAFARKRATLIAGTGYQYGDTDFLEYSERLYRNFARAAASRAAGRSPVGEALVQAKQRLPGGDAGRARHPREGAARGDAVRLADAARRTCPAGRLPGPTEPVIGRDRRSPADPGCAARPQHAQPDGRAGALTPPTCALTNLVGGPPVAAT